MFYPGDWSQTAAIVNDFMKTTLTQGDYGSDPNCTIHGALISPGTQHGLTTNMAAITVEFINNQALFMEGVQRSV